MDFQSVFDHSCHFSKNTLKTCRFYLVSLLTSMTPEICADPNLCSLMPEFNSHLTALFQWDWERIHQVILAIGFCFPLVTTRHFCYGLNICVLSRNVNVQILTPNPPYTITGSDYQAMRAKPSSGVIKETPESQPVPLTPSKDTVKRHPSGNYYRKQTFTRR